MEVKMLCSRKTVYKVGPKVATEIRLQSNGLDGMPLQEDLQTGDVSLTFVGSAEVTEFGLDDVVTVQLSKVGISGSELSPK